MPTSGLFVNLYNKLALDLYLYRNVYGQLMPPVFENKDPSREHYNTLADYGCAREGTHVFFFLKRKITYGGQISGNNDHGAFYLNGEHSPLCREANATLSWDEGQREIYRATNNPGIFQVQIRGNWEPRCQPYLIRFEDRIGLKGLTITSDDLYSEIGIFPYPLPSNSIISMGFCTLAPAEIKVLLPMIEESTVNEYEEPSNPIDFNSDPLLFDPIYSIQNLYEAQSKNHMIASILANPDLLPREMRPENSTICRRIPICPFKPTPWLDRADIVYYNEDEPIREGSIPNVIIHVSQRSGKAEIVKTIRYLEWLYRIIGNDAQGITVHLLSGEFTSTIRNHIPSNMQDQIHLSSY
jgi:hypothetical protein